MRTILVPVDTTATSENAVNFAVEWGREYGYDHILLLKTSYESVFNYITVGDGYALVNDESLNRQLGDAEGLLEHLRNEIIEKAPTIEVTTEMSELPLLRRIIELTKNNASIELILLGSDHKEVANDSFISANIISIARASPVKVLIVPDNYNYQVIRSILIPCDISHVTHLDRLSRFKSVLRQTDARLTLLNVDTKRSSAEINIKNKGWEEHLRQYLADIPYEISYSFDRDIIRGILSFTLAQKVDLIIALPGRHSFLYYLVSRSISEGIYRNAHQAVLILK